MSAKFFLDTNILAYCFERAAIPKRETARKLLRSAIETGNGAISYQVAQEFLNLALRKFPVPLTPAEAARFLETVLRPLCQVHSSTELLSSALSLATRYQLSWYDSLIVAAALEAECAILYTEDLQHGMRIGKLEVRNPFR